MQACAGSRCCKEVAALCIPQQIIDPTNSQDTWFSVRTAFLNHKQL
jgi:hypothetical protein